MSVGITISKSNHSQQQEGMDDKDMVFMMMRKINANE